MKISKESHKRMAVVIRDSQNERESADKTMGKIAPLGEAKDLETYVKNRVANVKHLYRILGTVSISKKKQNKTQSALCGCFNKFMQYILKSLSREADSLETQAGNVAYELQYKSKDMWIYCNKERKKISEINMDISDEFVHEVVTQCLRGSLKKKFL